MTPQHHSEVTLDPATPGHATEDAVSQRRELSLVVMFVALAFALGWLVTLPLWLGDGLASRWFLVLSVALMATPTIAALTVVLLVERPDRRAWSLGIWPLTPIRKVLGYGALGIVVTIALVLAALPVGALLGVYPADFLNLSGAQQLLEQKGAAPGVLPVSVGVFVASQIASLPVAAVLNVLPALGEEIGWRGWLLPKLMPLGTLPALLISGAIWGLWHAPVILLGYNYPDAPGWLALITMVGMCTVIGATFGWLRLRSGSVWPAALAHAAYNGAAGTYLLFARAGEHVDTTRATILGWSGWIVPLLLVAVLLGTKQLAPPKDLSLGSSAHPEQNQGPRFGGGRGAPVASSQRRLKQVPGQQISAAQTDVDNPVGGKSRARRNPR